MEPIKAPVKGKKSIESTSTIDASIITLIPCDYDSSEEDEKSVNISENSIESSDISDSSDDENELIKITQFIKLKKEVELIKEDKTDKNEIIIDYNKKMKTNLN